MNLEDLSIKQNKNMQNFCILKINELSNYQHMYENQIVDRAHICDIKMISYKIGQCKIERDYYTYFLHLLQVEYVNLTKPKTADIIQLTI